MHCNQWHSSRVFTLLHVPFGTVYAVQTLKATATSPTAPADTHNHPQQQQQQQQYQHINDNQRLTADIAIPNTAAITITGITPRTTSYNTGQLKETSQPESTAIPPITSPPETQDVSVRWTQ